MTRRTAFRLMVLALAMLPLTAVHDDHVTPSTEVRVSASAPVSTGTVAVTVICGQLAIWPASCTQEV